MSLLSVLILGLFLGMRHATDPDHVVAVTTLVSQRHTTRGAMLLGALWGVGHGLTLLVVGGAIIALGLVMPPWLGLSLELGVALMLIGLGVINLRRARQLAQSGHGHEHHGEHAHGGARPPAPYAQRLRSLIIGVVHGLAGSAAVALLVLSTIREPGWAFVYLCLFGAGTVTGMMLLTTAVSFPLAAAARRFGSVERLLGHVTGAVSVALGLFLVYQIGFVDGLFAGDLSWDPH
jgi:high-affinity nickel-transport protein